MPTLLSAWRAAAGRLKAAGVETPSIDARLLLEAAADVGRAEILAEPHRVLEPDAEARFNGFVGRRADRAPVSQILGRKGFWTLMLRVTPQVLTPRPETETLVEAALAAAPVDRPLTVLDLGVGSGAVILAILAERPLARGLGVDASEEAIAVARDNAAQLGLAGRLALLRGDWGAGLAAASFDLVVANPPYIASGEIASLAPEVRNHEPAIALDGGPDGLSAYRRLAPETLALLKAGGAFAFEIGCDQSLAVEALFRAAGAADLRAVKDLAGRDRVIAGSKKGLGKRPSNR